MHSKKNEEATSSKSSIEYPDSIKAILMQLPVSTVYDLARYTPHDIIKNTKLDHSGLWELIVDLDLFGVSLRNNVTVENLAPEEGATCAPVCDYEVIRNHAIAKVRMVTSVQAICTPGKLVLGGGFHIITPLCPSNIANTKPEYKILESGPMLQEVINASTRWRHLRAVGWKVRVYLENYVPSQNHPEGPDVYVYAIAARVEEATEGAGFWRP